MNNRSIRVITGTALLALAALLASLAELPPLTLREFVLSLTFLGVLSLSLLRPLPFGPHAHYELSTAVILAAALILPPTVTIGIGGLGPVIAGARLRPREWLQSVFNGSQIALQAWMAEFVLDALGWSPDHPVTYSVLLFAVPLAGLAMHVVNTIAVASVVALESQQRWWSTWWMIAVLDRTEATSYLAQWGLAVLAAVVVEDHLWPLALLLLPGALVFHALADHARLRLLAEERLVHQAFHDPLTGLPNRASFQEQLDSAFQSSSDPSERLAVLFLDLDRFKLINDTLGHHAGDAVLVEVASRLRSAVQPGDVVARMGGDEFTVLLQGERATVRAVRVAEQIADAMKAPFEVASRQFEVTTSIGIAHPAPQHQTSGELLQDADVALYQAKGAGRARFAHISQASRAAARERLALESDVRRALKHDEFCLAFQPKVALAAGEVIAIEALLRWNCPGHGELAAASFVPLAIELGLMPALGRWVLNEACCYAARWHTDKTNLSLPVSVNVSSSELLEEAFVDDVAQILEVSGLDGSRLQLEVSEDSAIEHMGSVVSSLQRLRELGVRAVLDDFGSGHANVLALSRMPVDAIQLGRSFMAELSRGAGPGEIVVETLVSRAHGLNMLVIATGVETLEQLERLKLMGCDGAQGLVFGAPVLSWNLPLSWPNITSLARVSTETEDAAHMFVDEHLVRVNHLRATT